jgi:hypothetical protein
MEREDSVLGRALTEPPSSKHLEHLPSGELADCSGCGLAVEAGPSSDVGEQQAAVKSTYP